MKNLADARQPILGDLACDEDKERFEGKLGKIAKPTLTSDKK